LQHYTLDYNPTETITRNINHKLSQLAYQKSKEWFKKDYTTPNGRYKTYRGSAKRRDLEFSLTPDEFASFWKKSCVYCGNEIKTIGLDRVDNEKGYVLSNVIPCCLFCNRMKGVLSRDIFIQQCSKISQHYYT
jgi:hypothetical protein